MKIFSCSNGRSAASPEASTKPGKSETTPGKVSGEQNLAIVLDFLADREARSSRPVTETTLSTAAAVRY
jgi:hypothetical protein